MRRPVVSSTPAPVSASPRLSTIQASEYTGIPVATLRYWRHNRTGPASYLIGSLNATDIAKMLGVSRATVYRYLADKALVPAGTPGTAKPVQMFAPTAKTSPE